MSICISGSIFDLVSHLIGLDLQVGHHLQDQQRLRCFWDDTLEAISARKSFEKAPKSREILENELGNRSWRQSRQPLTALLKVTTSGTTRPLTRSCSNCSAMGHGRPVIQVLNVIWSSEARRANLRRISFARCRHAHHLNISIRIYSVYYV